MKLFNKLALVAAISSFALGASAMTAMQDSDLSQVSGQDGVSIAADLHVNIGSFVYTDTDATGGSVSFNNIGINGTIAATLDIINNATFMTAATGGASVLGVAGAADATAGTMTAGQLALMGGQAAAVGAFVPVGDVVQIAIPKIAVAAGHELNVTVAGIKMGTTVAAGNPMVWGPSYGSFAMNDIKLQGTTAYIWAH